MIAEIINAITGLVKALTNAFRSSAQSPVDKYGPKEHWEERDEPEDDKGDLTRIEDQILARRTAKRKRTIEEKKRVK